jgi:ribosomal protein S18 acetylase RimI-like enzyme
MAIDHFRSLNPDFVPDQTWSDHYFRSCMEDPAIFLEWIVVGKERAGFVIFLIEQHRFVPVKFGVIREVFVKTSHRRMGIASRSADLMIRQMKEHGAKKVFVDTVAGDARAKALWEKAGFRSFTERLALRR